MNHSNHHRDQICQYEIFSTGDYNTGDHGNFPPEQNPMYQLEFWDTHTQILRETKEHFNL